MTIDTSPAEQQTDAPNVLTASASATFAVSIYESGSNVWLSWNQDIKEALYGAAVVLFKGEAPPVGAPALGGVTVNFITATSGAVDTGIAYDEGYSAAYVASTWGPIFGRVMARTGVTK